MGTTAWLFPGQGAQQKGMGAQLFAKYPDRCAIAEAVLGFSVPELCLGDDTSRLTDTRYLQPALFFVNALFHLDRAESSPQPDYFAGHSLGEFNALLAAGAFDFETGLKLVRRRGELMAQAGGGGMAAVVGPQVGRIASVLSENSLFDVDIANINAIDQVVISGPVESVRHAVDVLTQAKVGRAVPLKVSAAFHSRYMAEAAKQFGEFLSGFELRDPRIPVIANVTGQPYQPGTVRELLAAQVRSSVRWSDSMRYLIRQGVDSIAEVGPGRILTGLWAAGEKAWAGERPSVPAVPAVPAAAAAAARSLPVVGPEQLGDAGFRRDYGIRYAYLAGSMYKGIASTDLVVRMARNGFMGFYGAGGIKLPRLEEALLTLQRELGREGRFGMNLLHALLDPALEEATVDMYLRHDVRYVEAAGFAQLTPPLVRYRLSGAHWDAQGRPAARRRVLAKVSRPEVAGAFMRPAPEAIVRQLVRDGLLTTQEAEVGARLPVSDDVCVEADSGGHTDAGVAYVLMPAMLRLRAEIAAQQAYSMPIRVGAAGGLGSPESIAAAFVLGADFVVTGSVNQCSVEAGTSDAVKTMLAQSDVQDTAYAPAGDMFEIGARVQVLRKGTLFAARANKLYQLYRQYDSIEQIDAQTRATVEETYFRRSFDQVWKETREYYLGAGRAGEVERAEHNPKHRMALVFRWYFVHSSRMAQLGEETERVNYQIHTGPAIGAFNHFVRGTPLEDWRQRHVDVIAEHLMQGAAEVLGARLNSLGMNE